MRSPLNMTFGVEFEIALGFFPSEQKDPLLNWRHEEPCSIKDRNLLNKVENVLRGSVIRVLREAGLEADDCNNQDDAKDKQDYTKWSVSKDWSIIEGDNVKLDHLSHWGNGTLLDLSPEQRAEICFLDTEVVSRVLNCDIHALNEIQTAITAVILNLPVVLPRNTGMHVHVGNRSAGFPAETLQNIVAIVSCMENQSNQLHPSHRLLNHHILLPRFSFHRVNRGDPLRMAEFVYRYSGKDFLYYFGWNKGVCYNFEHLDSQKGKKTIEFRQHICTFDLNEIRQWIILVCDLVNIAYQSEQWVFTEILRLHAYDSEYNVIDLLKNLGLFGSAHYYSTRLYEHPSDIDVYNPES